MSFMRPFLLGPVFFWLFYLERGGILLHDAVGINCTKGKTTEHQGTDVSTRVKGCMLMIVFVLSDLT